MTTGGWIILIIMWGAIIISGVFCFSRILSTKKTPVAGPGDD